MLSLRRGAVVTATCVLALSAGAPARAMTGGSPDSSHPSVGMLMPRPDNGKSCGGTLITPTVFLTAGHCVAGRLGLGATTWSVSFSADPLAAPGTLSTGRLVLDPAYRANNGNAANDLGAVVFPTPVEGVTPTPVAQPLTSSWLASASLELVGYGATEAQHGAGGTTYAGRGTRYSGSTGLQALADEWTTTSGGASACDGDSGGALFANGALAGVISTGTPTCTGWTGATRLDTPTARQFLASL